MYCIESKFLYIETIKLYCTVLLYCIVRQRKDLLVVDFLEDVLEAAIIALEDGVLGAHVQRPALLQRVLETGVGESCDGLAKAFKASV